MSPTFAQLGVPDSICAALAARGITEPFDIQTATIEDALAGRDVCGRAPTGSGKTLAFGIPIVVGLGKAQPHRPKALILAPTRELADQIHEELKSFSKPVRVGVVYGGVGYGKQMRLLEQGVEVLVACPGRLEDLIERGDVELDAVERVVLDEADRMADMGFMPAVRRILDQTARHRQTVLFSATLDGDVAKLTREYQTNPVRHEVGEETPDIRLADHVFWKVDKADRTDVTAVAIGAEWPAIVFCRTRHGCDRLTKQLKKLGVDAVAIHGGRSQNQRTRALDDFSSNRAQALIATDVAARGIHVDGVTMVLHFDPPEDHKTYVHRSGRTARAGAGGVVVSLLGSDETRDAQNVMRQIGINEPITAPDRQILLDLASGDAKPERAPARVVEAEQNGGGSDGRSHEGRGGGRHRNQRNNNNSRRGGSSGSSRNGEARGGDGRNGDSRNGSGRTGSTRTGESRGGSGRNGQSRNDSDRGGAQRSGESRNGSGGAGGGRRRSAAPARGRR